MLLDVVGISVTCGVSLGQSRTLYHLVGPLDGVLKLACGTGR